MDARCLLDDLEVEQVNEIYIHFYTAIYPTSPQQLSIYWYKNTQEHVEIFEDVKQIFAKMKECKLLTTYTGDVFCIKNERLFVEHLLLLGIEQKESYQLHLINGVVKEVHHGKTNFLHTFNDLFDICFQSYDMYHSFSSSDVKQQITMLDKRNGALTVLHTESKEVDYVDKHLLIIDFFGHRIITTFIKLRAILYSILHSIIDNQTLNKWFYRLVERNEYATVIQTIETIESFHRDHPYDIRQELLSATLYDESSEEEKSDVSSRQLDSKEWIQTFCDLYLQKDSENNTLLSEVYYDYCTASGWTSTPVVSMAQFMKTLRSLNRYTIRRRSKGMMILGYRSLVSQQQTMLEDIKQEKILDRDLLIFSSAKEMKDTLHTYHDISTTSRWAREVILLLPRLTIPFTEALIEQFASNPYLKDSLDMFANYVEERLSKPLHIDWENDCNKYRELTKECVLYYPFSMDIRSKEGTWSANDSSSNDSDPIHNKMIEKEIVVDYQPTV